jgi:exopolysaccharide biosynthesis polyprenyl glycosylphosphotransferase
MLTHRATGLYRLTILSQALAVFVCFWVLYGSWVFLGHMPQTPFREAYVTYSLVVVLCVLAEGLLRTERLRWLTELPDRLIRRCTVRQLIAVIGGLSFYLVATQDARMSRGFMMAFIGACLPLFAITNRYLPAYLTRVLIWRFNRDRINILVLENPETMEHFRRRIDSGVYPGTSLAGYVTRKVPADGGQEGWLGVMADLDEIAEKHSVRQIVMPGLSFDEMFGRSVMNFCESRGIRLLLVNDAPARLGRRLTMTTVGGMEVLSPRAEPLEDPVNRAIKRIADIAIASMVLVTVFPCTSLFAWCCHRLQSPGSLFFKQLRSGRGGQMFEIYKYRTLHEANDDAARQVSKNDDRVFSLGRLMRKLSIDEIPQFLNVLKGDMSIVGPRPHLPQHDARFAEASEAYFVRHFVKPGITGLAQVKGFRGETKTRAQIRNRVRWDLVYLERWTPIMDSWIIIKTFIQVIRPPKGAY